MLRTKPTKEWEAGVKKLRDTYAESLEDKSRGQVSVFSRCVFERIVEIDTKSERLDADLIIESSWHNDDVLKILLMPQFSKNYHSMIHFLLRFFP
jgi:hypothetical protein